MIIRFEEASKSVAVEANKRDKSNAFSTGAEGFGAYGMFELNGRKYRLSCTLIDITHKSKSTGLKIVESK